MVYVREKVLQCTSWWQEVNQEAWVGWSSGELIIKCSSLYSVLLHWVEKIETLTASSMVDKSVLQIAMLWLLLKKFHCHPWICGFSPSESGTKKGGRDSSLSFVYCLFMALCVRKVVARSANSFYCTALTTWHCYYFLYRIMNWYPYIWHWYAEHHDDHHTHDHVHDPGVSSVSIVCEGNLDLEKVGSLLCCSLFAIIYDNWPYDFSSTWTFLLTCCCEWHKYTFYGQLQEFYNLDSLSGMYKRKPNKDCNDVVSIWNIYKKTWQRLYWCCHNFFQANIWLGTLLLERSEDIYRMKGLLSVQGMNERFVFQVS